jgi:hypothetical protein
MTLVNNHRNQNFNFNTFRLWLEDVLMNFLGKQ